MEPESGKTENRPAESSDLISTTLSFFHWPKAESFAAPARGFIPALLILILFLLAAIYVKSLFFGILAAVLTFKFEQSLERHFFGTKFMRGVHAVLAKIKAPFIAIRRRMMRKFGDDPESGPIVEASSAPVKDGIPLEERRQIATYASATTVILAVVMPVLVCLVLGYVAIPKIEAGGKKISQWALDKPVIKVFNQKLQELLPSEPEATVAGNNAPADGAAGESAVAGNPPAPADGGETVAENSEPSTIKNYWRNTLAYLRTRFAEAVGGKGTNEIETAETAWAERDSSPAEENNDDLASEFSLGTVFDVIKNTVPLINVLYRFGARAGSFVFDFFMFLFFFFYFLLKMALFSAKRTDPKQNLGEWTVSSIYESGWLPEVSENERKGAARIIEQIYVKFRTWLVGYFWIIVIETILYIVLFALFHVPCFLVLGFIAGSTILLPFLGPLLAFLLSIVVTILFPPSSSIIVPLVGIMVTFVVINGFLEQLFLYPRFVGEAIGLTLLETIVVVLLGAVIADIPGMILAVPAAALLKMLVPLFYKTLNKQLRLRRLSQAQTQAQKEASAP